jgi:putative colanic acid biosynthesis acetyltransferase WcaF
MQTNLSKYNNSEYQPGNKFKIILWYFVNVLFFINSFNPISGLKVFLLRLFGAKIGKGVVIKPGVNIKYPWLLEIGNYVWIGEQVWIDNLAKVSIQDNVCVSQGALLLCGNHNYKIATFDLITAEIILETGAWVGAKSIVGPGVTLHSHAILAVGSVATKNMDAFGIYQGNPAVKIRERKIEEIK